MLEARFAIRIDHGNASALFLGVIDVLWLPAG
jgi:hypothetical protein